MSTPDLLDRTALEAAQGLRCLKVAAAIAGLVAAITIALAIGAAHL